MKKFIILNIFLLSQSFLFAQTPLWSTYIDTSTTFSSPRPAHLNSDTIADIIIGGGLDGEPQTNGIVALDGATGSVLWSFATDEEIFASAQFQDINGDNIDDVFIGGRYAEFYAIDGATGTMIWEFFSPPATQAVDSGWFNFYTPQWIPDQNGDNFSEILISNGGNHALPSWITHREPGYLMVLDALTGNVLAKDTMPDGEETYCSPVVADFSNTNTLEIVFGSGGEDDGGTLWKVSLAELMSNDISNAVALATHPTRGFIAPSSLADMNDDGMLDIINIAFDGTVRVFDGISNLLIWSNALTGTETSAAPVIGNFTGDKTPDVFVILGKGHAPSYTDYYQVLMNGKDGTVAFKDSISQLHFASANAVDLNADGRDEALISLNFHNGASFSHQLLSIDFQNDLVSPFYIQESGVNITSTPLVQDIDGDGFLDFIYAYRADSTNPMAQNGFKVARLSSSLPIPATGVAWGSYMGSNFDGLYNYSGNPCGTLFTGMAYVNISCNGQADAQAFTNPSGGTAPYTFLWSDGSVADSLTNIDVGNYSLRLTDSTGCYVDQNFSASDPYAISFGGLIPPTCPGDSNATIQVASTGCVCMTSNCTYLWSNSGSITKIGANLWAGWQYVTITHSDGCVVVDSTNIPATPPMIASATVNHLPCYTYSSGLGSIELILSNPSNTSLLWSNSSSSAINNNLTPDTYSVQLNNTLGCKDSASYVITAPDTIMINPNVVNLSCNNDSSGQISVQISGGSPYFNFMWNNASTDQNISNLNPGYYSLVVTDSLGCVETLDSVLITEPSPISVSLLQADDLNCFNDNSGSVSIAVSGVQGNASFLWTNAATTQNISGLSAGFYSVVLTDSSACSGQLDSLLITEPAPINISVLQSDNLNCSGDNSGAISLSASGFTGSASYLWSNNATTQNISGLSAGFYSVVLTDSNSCSEQLDSVLITEPPVLSVALSSTDALISCNGTAAAVSSGGTPVYSYLWNNTSTTDSISDLCSGTYTVTVTDNNGCIFIDSVNISLISSNTFNANDANDLKVYPNPASDFLFIEGTLIKGETDIEIFNALGQKVIAFTRKNAFKLLSVDISSLLPGHYSMLLKTEGQMIRADVFIKKD